MSDRNFIWPRAALWAVTIATAAGCVRSPIGERFVTNGANPAFSPDGKTIAFQRYENGVFKIGLVGVEGGSELWVENGPGNAAYPTWTPSGGLLYMWGNDTETAYEAWKGNSKSGYGLRIFEDGVRRDLTTGRCRDYTPSVSADGKKAYFATTRGVTSESSAYSKAATSRIAEIDLPGGGEPRIIMDSPGGNNTGVVQPAPSPDGTLLVWGHLENFFDCWRIYGTRMGKFARNEWCPVTPRGLSALAPRWHPDGKIICFTGFRKGDPGWGVWVEEIASGKVKRLATGENPTFSPDGRSIAYDRDGKVYVCPFGAEDMPCETIAESFDDTEPENVFWSAENITEETRFGATDPRFVFGKGKTFFVRLKVKLDGTQSLRQLLIGDYAENDTAYQMFVNYDVWFAPRSPTAQFEGAVRKDYNHAGEYTLVGIRTPKRTLVQVDGGKPALAVPRNGPASLDHPRRIIVGRGLKAGESVIKAEIGLGWPNDVPKDKRREDLFK